ncbi:MAG: hypothetical protein J7K68_03095 [Candidatus Diapherotrites archaeon]|nr:hypothetical protein [Candidatus Diapherotrites archaeon]
METDMVWGIIFLIVGIIWLLIDLGMFTLPVNLLTILAILYGIKLIVKKK